MEGWSEGKGDQIHHHAGAVLTDCVTAKRAAGRRERYLTNLKVMLSAFARGREVMRLASIRPKDVEDWVGLGSSINTRATRRNRLSTLFAWAVRAGHLNENPCDSLEAFSYEPKPITTLTVEQTESALTWTRDHRPRFLGWLVLALLAGMRPEEADKVEWSDIAEGNVRLDAAKAKLRERRIVHLTDSARAWMDEAERLKSELPVTMSARRLYIESLRDHLGFKTWPVKILRKTCASNLLAAWQDAGKVADEMGHSVGVLLKNYRDLVPRERAEQWLALVP